MEVYVERDSANGRRIHLRTQGFDRIVTAKAKRIIGAQAKWDRSVHPNRFVCWTYALDFTTCLQFREEFGKDLRIGPMLTAWAKEEKKRRERLQQILSSSEFDLPAVSAVAPRLAEAMASRSYQQVGAAFLHNAQRALLADEPGLGKTLQSMGAVIEADLSGPILVMAPSAAAQITWPDEIRNWLPGDNDRVYAAVGNRSQREREISRFQECCRTWPQKRHWLIVNFEMARASQKWTKLCPEVGPYTWTSKDKRTNKTVEGNWFHPYSALFDENWSAIIADESQRALVTRTPVKADQTLQRAGAGMLRIREGGLRIALSGTPFRGKVENLWGTLNWLRPDIYTSYWNWVKKWFAVYDDGMALQIGELLQGKQEAFYRELDGIMIRRTKLEAAPELPPKQYAGTTNKDGDLYGIWLEMEPKQKKAYTEIVKSAAANLESGRLLATGILAEMTRLKQFASCSGDVKTEVRYEQDPLNPDRKIRKEVQVFYPTLPSNKFNWLVDWLDERGIVPDKDGSTNGDGKVIIVSQFTQLLNMFNRELNEMGVDTLMLTGETKAKDRKAAKDKFQTEGGPRVFILNTMAGGVSLTLDAADDVIFLDEDWIPDNDTQVEDRAHRVSRMHQVTIWKLRSIGTIDETIGTTSEVRDNAQKILLDGRRGVEYAKKLVGA